MQPDPIFLDHQGHRTLIKWHRARRKASDAEFTPTRILDAMRIGASVEVDLVVHADKGFAILHDLELDHGTTGSGLVCETSAETLRRLFLRGNDGEPIADRVMLLEDLCDLLAANPAHRDALLQLDYKEDLSRLSPAVIANFAAAVSKVAHAMILSGGDSAAVASLAAATPGLRTGYDPTYVGVLDDLQSREDFSRFIAAALKTAPEAAMIYLDYELILAADAAGVDLIRAVHDDNRRVDAWTIRSINSATLAKIRRLLDLRVDQITTDDPEGLLFALAEGAA
ncbi:glycerophosphodiester phosphodiesterase [Agrobacterium sp. RAC06]|uniref:glycerophosphodiester phosphodiesterase n=1 Tax=Agrobacterium sp. RAC06 TaxID=1842536 RepID=UPI00083D73CE|nr:glycerophosphodiester phosphodiesterase family protein [Agrobacterium sp. RAC06]AOG09623.1 glycerophosphoryl diester phosphodiesterase family protein [Agrobacterium sp. RAC06]